MRQYAFHPQACPTRLSHTAGHARSGCRDGNVRDRERGWTRCPMPSGSIHSTSASRTIPRSIRPPTSLTPASNSGPRISWGRRSSAGPSARRHRDRCGTARNSSAGDSQPASGKRSSRRLPRSLGSRRMEPSRSGAPRPTSEREPIRFSRRSRRIRSGCQSSALSHGSAIQTCRKRRSRAALGPLHRWGAQSRSPARRSRGAC